jgi:hypothetical protein
MQESKPCSNCHKEFPLDMFTSKNRSNLKQCSNCRNSKTISANLKKKTQVINDDEIACTNCVNVYKKVDMKGCTQCFACRSSKAAYLRQKRAQIHLETADNINNTKKCIICFKKLPLIEFKGKYKDCKSCQGCRDSKRRKL